MTLSASSSRHSQQGVAVIVVLALLAILMLYTTANMRSLRIMSQELKLVEQRHWRYWNRGPDVPTGTVQPTLPAAKPTLP